MLLQESFENLFWNFLVKTYNIQFWSSDQISFSSKILKCNCAYCEYCSRLEKFYNLITHDYPILMSPLSPVNLLFNVIIVPGFLKDLICIHKVGIVSNFISWDWILLNFWKDFQRVKLLWLSCICALMIYFLSMLVFLTNWKADES